jgi:hypothetical protein
VGKLCFLTMVLGFANSLLAQETAVASGQFYGPLASGTAFANGLRANDLQGAISGGLRGKVVLLQPRAPVCSVPLKDARIPKDVQFTVRELPRDGDKSVATPPARVPAPSCDSAR